MNLIFKKTSYIEFQLIPQTPELLQVPAPRSTVAPKLAAHFQDQQEELLKVWVWKPSVQLPPTSCSPQPWRTLPLSSFPRPQTAGH